MGIGIGMAVAIVFILIENYKRPFHFETSKHLNEKSGEITIQLSEEVTFLNKANIQRALNIIPDNRIVTIDASKSLSIDPDVIEIIDEFKINAMERNITVNLIARDKNNLKGSPVAVLEDSVNNKYELEPAMAN